MVDTAWLTARGIDPQSIHDYVARGRLERLVRGVYRRPTPQSAPAADQSTPHCRRGALTQASWSRTAEYPFDTDAKVESVGGADLQHAMRDDILGA